VSGAARSSSVMAAPAPGAAAARPARGAPRGCGPPINRAYPHPLCTPTMARDGAASLVCMSAEGAMHCAGPAGARCARRPLGGSRGGGPARTCAAHAPRAGRAPAAATRGTGLAEREGRTRQRQRHEQRERAQRGLRDSRVARAQRAHQQRQQRVQARQHGRAAPGQRPAPQRAQQQPERQLSQQVLVPRSAALVAGRAACAGWGLG